jgi:two-component system cell cycle response regulator DivK
VAKILIVEDSPDNMKLFRTLLTLKGYEVAGLPGGDGLLEEIERGSPDLVLMDIQLPDIDGTTVLARIREDKTLDAMPVLAVSASVMPDQQQRVVGSGFDGFIAKPISIKPFLAAVRRALEEGRAK